MLLLTSSGPTLIEQNQPSKANKQVTDSQKVIYGVGTELINEKKQQVLDKTDDSKTRSLLSLLSASSPSFYPRTEVTYFYCEIVKANMAESEDQRLTHDELLSMISTFLFAGSDTSSIALTWTLHQLALNPSLQSRLRDEVLSLELPSAADASIFWPLVDALSYLDKVCKESLRLVPPVHSTIRVAAEDDVIPTSEPVILTDGTKQEGIRIAKGQFVHVPMEGFSLNKEVWGEDAWNFKHVSVTASLAVAEC